MKLKYSIALVGFALFAALTLAHSVNDKRLAADGAPAPPWPKNDDSLRADGAPAPPWPKLDGSFLIADGAPAPPWPKGTEIAIG